MISGKWGGKELNAHTVGSNADKVEGAVELAKNVADLKLVAL